jgi:starch synthase
MDENTSTTSIMFAISEADPFIKVGGLGDVAGSLPYALKSIPPVSIGGVSLDVRLILPLQPGVRNIESNLELISEFSMPRDEKTIAVRAFQMVRKDLPVYFIDGDPIAKSERVYTGNESIDSEKYVFFSLAALELARQLNWHVDIFHANDWHTAAAVFALKQIRKQDPFYSDTKSLLAIHNLPYMGFGSENALTAYGLSPSMDPELPEWAHQVPLPMGLSTADKIIAVSPTYAREILTAEFGCGLEKFLSTREVDISGILNGLDPQLWNPQKDPSIRVNFDCQSLEKRVGNKAALQQEFNLPTEKNAPLFILIGRMDSQKGIDIAIEALRQSKSLNWQAILLGTGVPSLENACSALEKEMPDRVRVAIKFDPLLSRRMYAGGDILLMPSRYEPCGLAQMIAMRYGCVPLARATGGLKDSIVDGKHSELNTGFLFPESTVTSLIKAMKRCLAFYAARDSWKQLQINGMNHDFSWDRSARSYAEIYRKLKG